MKGDFATRLAELTQMPDREPPSLAVEDVPAQRVKKTLTSNFGDGELLPILKEFNGGQGSELELKRRTLHLSEYEWDHDKVVKVAHSSHTK